MKKHSLAIFLSLILLLAAIPGVPVSAENSTRKELCDSSVGVILEDGGIYQVYSDTTITNSVTGGAGITIPEGAEVCIFVKKGATLRVTGGDGAETVGGGAGILVPSSSKLILTGAGTVIATGGKAGKGGNGSSGSDGVTSMEGNYYYGGRGGKGGNGGGGAGAGIGTNGGDGALGGEQSSYDHLFRREDDGFALSIPEEGVIASLCETEAGDTCGTDGTDGAPGKAAATPGSIFILGTLTVQAASGDSNVNGLAGTAGADADTREYGWKNIYAAGGGGGGGAGHGGYAAEKGIGPGGSGGGAGGQGGTGGTYWSATETIYLTGGTGGTFNDETKQGTAPENPVIYDKCWGGFGGSGGKSELSSDRYTLEIEKETTVEGAPDTANYSYFDPTDTRVSLANCRIVYRDGGSETFSGAKTGEFVTDFLYGETVDLPGTTSRNRYVFGGWYRDTNCVDGPEKDIDPEWGAGTIYLYAKWIPEGEKVMEDTKLSEKMEIALFATGGAVVLSILLFIFFRMRHQKQIRNRRVRR